MVGHLQSICFLLGLVFLFSALGTFAIYLARRAHNLRKLSPTAAVQTWEENEGRLRQD